MDSEPVPLWDSRSPAPLIVRRNSRVMAIHYAQYTRHFLDKDLHHSSHWFFAGGVMIKYLQLARRRSGV